VTTTETHLPPKNGAAVHKPEEPKLLREASKAPKAATLSVKIPLEQVLWVHDWNARSKSDTEAIRLSTDAGYDKEVEASGLGGIPGAEPGLYEMIVAQGQLDPVDVRPNLDKKTSDKHPFRGVAGFRRATALSRIAQDSVKAGVKHPLQGDPEWDSGKPTIHAIVQSMTESEARRRNLNENTGRSNFSTPDLAFGISEYRKAFKADHGREPTGAEMAAEINKSPTIVSQCLKVMRLPENISKHWRACGKGHFDGKDVVTTSPLGLSLMYELAQSHEETPENTEREYAKLLLSTGPQGGKPGSSPEARKLESAIKAAKKLGELAGYLGFAIRDVNKITPKEWELIAFDCVGYVRPNGKPATESQTKQIVEAMRESFKLEQQRLSNPEDGEETEDEEENQARRNKRG
jgi:hypothetical protein